MAETRAHLLTRKGDLMSALRLLEQDYVDGAVDEAAYRATRKRYEEEAADVLERLETLPSAPANEIERHPPVDGSGRGFRWALMSGMVVLILGAVALFLVAALHGRSGTGSSNATTPPTAIPTSPQLVAAQKQVRTHPHSVRALVDLGNAYLQVNQTDRADGAFLAAMKVAPSSPEPKTMHAMVLGSQGEYAQALNLLTQVESANPRFARAWLLDWLISTRTPKTRSRAIAAGERFLALEPHASVAASVRNWLLSVKKAGH